MADLNLGLRLATKRMEEQVRENNRRFYDMYQEKALGASWVPIFYQGLAVCKTEQRVKDWLGAL